MPDNDETITINLTRLEAEAIIDLLGDLSDRTDKKSAIVIRRLMSLIARQVRKD